VAFVSSSEGIAVERKLMANRRIEILLAVLSRRKMGGSVHDLLWNLLTPPCSVMGDRLVRRLEDGPDNTVVVWIKGWASPLFFPKEFDLIGVHKVLTEMAYPRNWHYYCAPETPIVPGDVVLDCGSAEGLFMLLARKLGATGIAIEPHPTYIRALRKTFANDDGVQLVASALSNKAERGVLFDCSVGSRVIADDGNSKNIEIKIETLDTICDRLHCQPTYLKADLEGFEEKMLEGAADTIATYRPKIAITTYHDENNAEVIAGLLKRFCPGYRIKTKGLSNRYGKSVMLHAWT
jgi:FkbM family methyltransferase